MEGEEIGSLGAIVRDSKQLGASANNVGVGPFNSLSRLVSSASEVSSFS